MIYAKELIISTIPIVVISSITVISLRLFYIKDKGLKISIKDELFKLTFIIYILCLFQIVTYRDVGVPGFNIVPFKEIFRYDILSELFFENVIGNMMLFVPYGIFISKVFKSCKVYYPLILSFITSLSIEVVQGVIGRVFDIDDVILNILGAVLGYYLYLIFKKIKNGDLFRKYETLLNIIFILLIGGLICFLIV